MITTLLSLAACLPVTFFSPAITPKPTPIIAAPMVHQDTLVSLINQDRRSVGIAPLREDSRLDASATQKACQMQQDNLFSHLDTIGQYSWKLFLSHGYNYHFAAENLALQKPGNLAQDDAIDIAAAWMASLDHRENMLNPLYQDIGVGYCGRYSAAHFGTQQ